ncbi:MAG TPA: sigma-70 family RNA polymerase sigma factor [Candidatus Angelobacter sp.]|nr:sigma-70 family RNA polymerase sigma factor [Candidatus Angelobacter sp.]
MSPATASVDVGLLYERHAPEIHDFLVRTVRDHATAEDLTQTTFIRLMERGGSVREVDKVRPWLFTVAHNLAVTHVTRRRPTDPIEAAFDIASGEKGPEDEALAIAAAALVWDAAASLEPRQYAVLDLSVRRGFTVGEIAGVLEITPAHAAVVVHRAREALAQAIRLLVVVRQRRHCARLAELVPAGTDMLTADLRASVDRHMRRCEVCREVGARLTEPDQLLALLPLLPLPLALHTPPLLPHGVAPHHVVHLGNAARKVGHTLMQPAALATIGALVLGGTGLGIALHHGSGGPAPDRTVQAVAPRSGLGTGPGGTAVAPGETVAQVPPGDGHGGSASAAPSPTPAPVAIDYGNDVLFIPVTPPPVGLGDQSAGNTPAPGPQPLLDRWVGPVSTPAGPASTHVVVWQPTTGKPPSVTVTAAGQTVGPAPSSQAAVHSPVFRLHLG